MIFYDEASYIDPKTWRKLKEIDISHWSGGIDFGFEDKPKKEKKMSRKATHEDVQEALEAFAAELGLDYSTCREELNSSQIDKKFLPKTDDLSVELTQETKQVEKSDTWATLYERYYEGFGYKKKTTQEATILGKINAIAEHLGVTFEVQPERVVTTPVKVKAVKKTVAKKSKVTAKKGKK